MGARALIFLVLAGCGSVLSQTRPPPLAATHAEPVVPARARYHYLVARLAIEEERWPEAEAALSKRFSSKSLEGMAAKAAGLNADIHADAEYRAHLIGVMARRAVDAAVGK